MTDAGVDEKHESLRKTYGKINGEGIILTFFTFSRVIPTKILTSLRPSAYIKMNGFLFKLCSQVLGQCICLVCSVGKKVIELCIYCGNK